MQKGSLITPTDGFLQMIDTIAGRVFSYIPKPPEKGEVYVCGGTYLGGTDSSKPCILVDGFEIYHHEEGKMQIDAHLWKELQPPMKIDIEEMISEHA